MEHQPRGAPVDWPESIVRGDPPTLAVWKFASCDGCQLSLLDCEDELLAIVDRVRIADFAEATSATIEGPYDVSLVEGSITTPHDAERIVEIRRRSRLLVTIGACATAGGVQALRNGADVEHFRSIVYATPAYASTLATSTPISDHVHVDLELHGCPVDRSQLVGAIADLLNRHLRRVPSTSVCTECKASGATCVLVARGSPCLGPVTRAGCGAICPSFHRGCYGCFGPMESPNVASLREHLAPTDAGAAAFDRLLHTFTTEAFGRLGDGGDGRRRGAP